MLDRTVFYLTELIVLIVCEFCLKILLAEIVAAINVEWRVNKNSTDIFLAVLGRHFSLTYYTPVSLPIDKLRCNHFCVSLNSS